MKTLIYGAGPIGRWLSLRLAKAGSDVTLLARGETYRSLARNGITIVDGLTGERQTARVPLVELLQPEDRYDLVVVAMQKASRLAVCPVLSRNEHLASILFLGNDVSGFHSYLDHLPAEKVLLGFPGAGGGWDGGELVVMDREKPGGPRGELYLGELDGEIRARTQAIGKLFETAQIKVSLERDMDGWLKYHFAFIAPTTGVIVEKGGNLSAVAADPERLHRYCRACREAGDVLRKVGYRKRQPPVFNLYYWMPRWLEPVVFKKLFGSRSAAVRFGLHAPGVVPELLEMSDEFAELKERAGLETPTLDALLATVPRPTVPRHPMPRRPVPRPPAPCSSSGIRRSPRPRRSSAMQRVLVAGSTGYLGGFVCRELSARGHFVRALARAPEKLAPLEDSLDEIVEAEVTRTESLEHVCDGIDVVFSSVGITRQKDGLTFRDVDYQGNKNLLQMALRAGVRKFVYVSAVHGARLRHLDIVDAHEAFVEELEASEIDHTVVRPTGYFSDMGELFEMARKGRVWLIGSGTNRVNPIHGADLAIACADAIENRETEIEVGGPQTMTWREVAQLAFEVLEQPAKVTSVPEWLMWPVVRGIRLFNRHQGELLAFFTTMATLDVVAPASGTHTLEAHYRSLGGET